MNIDITENLDEIMEAGAALEAAREVYEAAKERFRQLVRGKGQVPTTQPKPASSKKKFRRGVAKRDAGGLSVSQRVLAYVIANPGCRATAVVGAVGKEDEAAVRSALKKHAQTGRLANVDGQWYPGNKLAQPGEQTSFTGFAASKNPAGDQPSGATEQPTVTAPAA